MVEDCFGASSRSVTSFALVFWVCVWAFWAGMLESSVTFSALAYWGPFLGNGGYIGWFHTVLLEKWCVTLALGAFVLIVEW